MGYDRLRVPQLNLACQNRHFLAKPLVPQHLSHKVRSLHMVFGLYNFTDCESGY